MSDEKKNPETGDSKEKSANTPHNAAISGKREEKSKDLAKTNNEFTTSESKSDKNKKTVQGKTKKDLQDQQHADRDLNLSFE